MADSHRTMPVISIDRVAHFRDHSPGGGGIYTHISRQESSDLLLRLCTPEDTIAETGAGSDSFASHWITLNLSCDPA